MSIGSVNCSPAQLLASDAVTVDARRSNRPNAGLNTDRKADPGSGSATSASTPARAEFLLGASAYRRVLATLESESEGALPRSGAQAQSRSAAYAADAGSTFTGQRAQRSYQDAGQLDERESLSSLFGVDLFV